MGLSIAFMAIVARRIGEKEKDKAGVSAVQAVIIAVIASLTFAIAGIFFAKDLLALIGTNDNRDDIKLKKILFVSLRFLKKFLHLENYYIMLPITVIGNIIVEII